VKNAKFQTGWLKTHEGRETQGVSLLVATSPNPGPATTKALGVSIQTQEKRSLAA